MSRTFVGMPPLPEAARTALADIQLRQNLAHATGTIRAKRAAVVAEVEDWEELRLAGAAMKDDVLLPSTTTSSGSRSRCSSAGRWCTGPGTRPRPRVLRWALEGIVIVHLTVARVAEALAVAWDTANDAVLAEGKRLLIDEPSRFDGVQVVGVDEHVWRHTRKGDRYVTVIIDLTPIRDGTGPARLLDMADGRSKQAFQQWLSGRPQGWRDAVEVVAMDGFTGFKTATTEELPDAVPVMDPFHVVRLAGQALDECRRRVQQAIHGHRGRKGDPLYAARRTLPTGAELLTDKQKARLASLFTGDVHVEVEATWGIYQRMIAAYREPDRKQGRQQMQQLIASVSSGVPEALTEILTLGHPETASRRRARLLRQAGHEQRTDRGDQRPARTPPRLGPRLPQPHQLHREMPT